MRLLAVLSILICLVAAEAAVNFQYTVSFAGEPTRDCAPLYNMSCSLPFDRTRGQWCGDFLPKLEYYADVNSFDSELYSVWNATIDPADNLFITMSYGGRITSVPHNYAWSLTSWIMKAGECNTLSHLTTLKFCYVGPE